MSYKSQSNTRTGLSNQLDFLLAELNNPKPATTIEKTLSYLAYYYPKIKNLENIRLLTFCVINSPLFNNLDSNNTIKLIDFYTFIIIEKYKISVPTLPFPEFYNSILQGLFSLSLDSRSLPIITGCLNSKLIRDQKYGGFYPANQGHIAKIDKEFLKLFKISMKYNLRVVNDLNKNLIMLSLLNGLFDNDISFYQDLQSTFPMLSKELISLIYGNGKLIFDQLHRLSGLSILYTKLVLSHPDLKINLKNLEWNLLEIQSFTEKLSNLSDTERWNDNKSILFSLVIIFESIVSLMINSSRSCKLNIRFSKLILQNLLNSSFIIDKVGTGGFESYNLIYLTCSTYLNDDPVGVIQLVEYWFSMIRFGYKLNESFTEQSRLLFILNFIDNKLEKQPKLSRFMDIINDLLMTSPNQPILEACHSIKLKNFQSSTTTIGLFKTPILWEYIELSISQFPERLSLSQMRIIIETIAKTLSPDITLTNFQSNEQEVFFKTEFLNPLLNLLSKSPNPQLKQTTATNPYSHYKASLCSLLLSIMIYVPLPQFIPFLTFLKKHVMDDLIIVTKKEREILLGELYDGLILTNRYFNQKGELGFRWWYKELEFEDKRFTRL